ncbi:aconitase X [Methanopyrus sp.]
MYLTKEEERILNGEEGELKAKLMEVLVKLGDVFDAERLVRPASVHVSGVSYRTIGDAGLRFLRKVAEDGLKVSVPTSVNPCGICLDGNLPVDEEFERRQREIMDALESLGTAPVYTCVPYQQGFQPSRGDLLAWGESSAVFVANTYYGARANREGAPATVAAAVVGRIPEYGMHLDENRVAEYEVVVEFEPRNDFEWSALGYYLGEVLDGIPVLRLPTVPSLSNVKYMGAAAAASGALAMAYIPGITPEEPRVDGTERIEVEREDVFDLVEERFGTEREGFSFTGCPHRPDGEIQRFDGCAICCPANATLDGHRLRGTCPVVAPIEDVYDVVFTDSLKAAHYLASRVEVNVGPL